MASYVELIMDRGANFRNVINLTDDVTNNVVNITNYTITSKMKRSYYSANTSANLVITIDDAANGVVVMSLAAANTANISPGRYVFDVLSEDAANNVSRLIEGLIIVTPKVT